MMAATYTFDVFSSLDGFGAASGNWTGYWGKQGPELLDHRLALYDEVTADRVADLRRRVLVGGTDLKSAVGKTDFETPTRHERGMPTGCDVKTGSPYRLHESVAHAPLVLGEQHTAQLGEADGRIVEHSQDRLAIGDRQSNESLLGVQCDEERIARVLEAGRVQQASQFGDVPFADEHTGEPHATAATRRSGASNGGRFARISPVLKLATARERGGFFRDETRAARISFPREPKAKRGNP